MRPDAILIAGPTASGKSALAVRLAKHWGGVVVNADALQVYDGLRILTARPRDDEMEEVPHHLYGHVPPDRPYSVGEWRTDVEALISRLPADTIPVFCGGTGLYFRALVEGLDDLPSVPDTIRAYWRERSEHDPIPLLHRELERRDPAAALKIRPTDRQRVVRALELVESTNRPLAELQRKRGAGLYDPNRAKAIVLTPPREALRDRIAQRFHAMLCDGAMDEALAFANRFDGSAPLAEKAIGLRELLAAGHGGTALDQAVELSIIRSRQYAKRQETWFRNQFGPEWTRYADPLDVPID
ncbi:tRNA (adenosine(37)-N6)-dimethylallyltransferase MiaA [Aureimonas sp. AU4]|uniref:tRNA (adenosine(37)-N6)-dimethylallyltransferase MiaA n=1 Tax=Aureimonas sp. AU4 TaxID=1638163 RepID=UPI000784CBB1|nr:tRNA (adenosine(37)-N6)-dimethylallyltransferase MiaA [Aureimonas sp. AU4]